MLIFIGPTGNGLDLAGLNVAPPASQGDIAAAVLSGEDTIVLIDGYFTQHLAPWHKEILFAIEQNVKVIGAGSLGAIRAVECERYGAKPVGVIADWYKYGTCVDDADVALVHGPGEDGYKPLSVPLVNILATAREMLRLGVISCVEDIVLPASKIHYTDRSWGALKRKLDKLCHDLKFLYVDQKALDARDAIDVAFKEPDLIGEPAKNVFTQTMVSLLLNDVSPPGGVKPWEVAKKREEAENFWLMAEMASALGIKATGEDVFEESSKMWKHLGISTSEDAENWMKSNLVDEQKWNIFASKKAIVQKAKNWFNSASKGSQIVPITNEYQFFTTK